VVAAVELIVAIDVTKVPTGGGLHQCGGVAEVTAVPMVLR
jgi:hypothetical protein